MICKSFIKWAGGKRRLLPTLLPLLRGGGGRYHEPFLGGGAVFFGLLPASTVLSDANERLIGAYVAVRDNVESLIAQLSTFPYDREVFLQTRTSLDMGSSIERAVKLVFLNKTCFNGLYRVNSKGQFNVPFGRHTNPTICDASGLRAASAALRGVDIRHEPFERVLDRAVAGDVVYFDPPYLPLSVTSSFTGYTPDGFSLADHRHLRDVGRELADRGVRVVISNSAAQVIRELYADGFVITEIQAARDINAKGDRRAAVTELIVVPSSQSASRVTESAR
jgi:DNA adenine methylase